MNLPVPRNSTYGVWLRSPSSSGGKDWRGFVTDLAVISQWGKTNFLTQEKAISDRSSRLDLDKKVREKLDKGYRVIGEYDPSSGWSHESPPRSSLVASSTPKPTPRQRPPLRPQSHEVASWLSDANEEWF
jgi:hypothetical protein